jgi:hypothetical protein
VGTLNSGGKLTIWNITSLVERIPEYTVWSFYDDCHIFIWMNIELLWW